jgi:hypothetical protein
MIPRTTFSVDSPLGNGPFRLVFYSYTATSFEDLSYGIFSN